MGLSIHYSGQLRNASLLPDLVEEVLDVAKAHGWKTHSYDATFPSNKFSDKASFEKIYGINFTPLGSETVSITFLSNGALVCPLKLDFFGDADGKEEGKAAYTISVKTQYAGVKIHQFLILFFKYLKGKYFSDFALSDESGYWETNDEEEMKTQFRNYEALLDNFALAIETFPVLENENLINYFERLMNKVGNLKK